MQYLMQHLSPRELLKQIRCRDSHTEVLLTPTHLAIFMKYTTGGEIFDKICTAGQFSEDEVYFKATDLFSERWQSAWIITAFWDIIALCLLSVMRYLWAPSQSSQRYAYSAEAVEDDGDEEAQSLMKGISDGGDLGLVKMEKKERNLEHGDVFSVGDDEAEEDKRE